MTQCVQDKDIMQKKHAQTSSDGDSKEQRVRGQGPPKGSFEGGHSLHSEKRLALKLGFSERAARCIWSAPFLCRGKNGYPGS